MFASGHGPVFGLATPTNPEGGWSFDANFMGRGGDGYGLMFRPALGYGLTENLKLSISGPVVLHAEPFSPSRLSAFTSMSGDFEGVAIWRFHRQDTGIGSRFESAAIGGIVVPGPQDPGGALKNFEASRRLDWRCDGHGLAQPLRVGRSYVSTLLLFRRRSPSGSPFLQLRLCVPAAIVAYR